MSYARFSETSNVYIYEAGDDERFPGAAHVWVCCGCWLQTTSWRTNSVEQLRAHLTNHRAAGRLVPDGIIERILDDLRHAAIVASGRLPYVDPVTGDEVMLTLDPLGVHHPGCTELADVSIEVDAFYCQTCTRSGRISGAWVAHQLTMAATA